MYDQLVSENPGKSDAEMLVAHRKEVEEYFDFSNPKARVFIAKNDTGEYCGYLWMGERNSEDYWDFQKPQWIYDIVVDPKFRGNGLGRLLMQKGEEFALETNRSIGLFVHEDNSSAINLYKAEGYFVKCVPMSKKVATDISDFDIEGYSIRCYQNGDEAAIHELGLESYRKMVLLSKDVSNEQISSKYGEYREKIGKMDRNHCTFVVESENGMIAGFIFVGISDFSERVGLIYDSGVAPKYKDSDIVRVLITRIEAWCEQNNLSTLYYVLHAQVDISHKALEELGFVVPGFFMEKDLVRTI